MQIHRGYLFERDHPWLEFSNYSINSSARNKIDVGNVMPIARAAAPVC